MPTTIHKKTKRMLIMFFVLAYAIIWGFALRSTLRSVAATTSNVLRFGLPVAYWWIFAIALLIGSMTLLLIALTILAWKRHYWSLLGRIAISIPSLAAITFSGMLAYWSFFIALFI